MSGIFGLSAYNDQNLAGLILDKTRETYREYGYRVGGYTPAPDNLSSTSRIDYSNDTQTASKRGNLNNIRVFHSQTSNSNYSWVHGNRAEIEKIDFSNDNSTASIRANSQGLSSYTGGCGNSNYGWFGGGFAPERSTINRLDYSNDLTNATIRTPLTQAKGLIGATGTSNYGWFGGGYIVGGVTSSRIERIDFTNDLNSPSVRTTLSFSRYGNGATGNSNFGYFMTGFAPSNSRVDRLTYSNDLSSVSIRGPLNFSHSGGCASGNSNFGYYNGSGSSRVERIDYSNDSVTASLRGNMDVTTNAGDSSSSSHNFGGSPISQYGVFPKPFGYFGGGNTATVDRIDYSTDTSTASVRGSLVRSGYYSFAATSNKDFGYFAGQLSSPSPVSKITRISYSNDLSISLDRGNMSIGRDRFGAAGNVNYGYFVAGNISLPYGTLTTRIDRLDYSNDLNNNLVRGNFNRIEALSTGTANLNFAYFSGGTSQRSTIARLNYSNDTSNSSVRSNLSDGSITKGATGNNNFGYIGGGDDITIPAVYSLVQRINYANDTTTASVRGPLTIDRRYFSATGNSNFGYFGGSNSPFLSSVDRVDYSNDTATASLRGPLSAAKTYHSACSPLTPSSAFSPDQLIRGTSDTDFQPTSTFFDIQSMRRIEDTTNESVKKRVLGSYGYFAGEGNTTGTRIDRVDYSNDTATASVRSSISVARYFLGGTGNSNFGYIGGGRTPGAGPTYTRVDRIDYSNDSANVSIRTPLTSASYKTGFGNSNFGYFAHSQGGVIIDKIDYSNDTNVVFKSVLYRPTYYRASTGNNNFGYVQEGLNTSGLPTPGASSIVERINYSNDSATASIRGPLSLAKYNMGATGNSNFGYFGGGATPGASVTVDRIDYSNDTATASVRGPLSLGVIGLAATGNSNFGYFGCGTPGTRSTVDRIDYSNDTASASTRGPLSLNRVYIAATTNAINS